MHSLAVVCFFVSEAMLTVAPAGGGEGKGGGSAPTRTHASKDTNSILRNEIVCRSAITVDTGSAITVDA
jgi:hypothetical protein